MTINYARQQSRLSEIFNFRHPAQAVLTNAENKLDSGNFFNWYNFPAFVGTAFGASPMGQFRFIALRTQRQ